MSWLSALSECGAWGDFESYPKIKNSIFLEDDEYERRRHNSNIDDRKSDGSAVTKDDRFEEGPHSI